MAKKNQYGIDMVKARISSKLILIILPMVISVVRYLISSANLCLELHQMNVINTATNRVPAYPENKKYNAEQRSPNDSQR